MEFFLFVWAAAALYYILRPAGWAVIGGALGYLIGKRNQADPGQELAKANDKIKQLLKENKELKKVIKEIKDTTIKNKEKEKDKEKEKSKKDDKKK